MTDPNYDRTTPLGNGDRIAFAQLRHVSWGAIFVGLVVAIALQILLGLLGVGLGFTLLNPTDPMGSVTGWGITTGIYIVLVQIVSLFCGGYIAARLASARTNQTAVFHGLSIWALATIIMVWLGGNTVGLAVNGLGSAISAVGSGSAQAVAAIIPDDINLPEVSYDSLPEPIKQKLQQNGITPQNFQQEMRNVFNQAVSQQERQQLMQRLRQAAASILRSPGQAPEEIDKAIDDVFGQNGILSEEDLNQMRSALQRQLNLSDQETRQIVTQVQQTVDDARSAVKEGVQTAKQQTTEAAEKASDAIGSMALWLFLANLLALIAAVVGGRLGEVKDTLYP